MNKLLLTSLSAMGLLMASGVMAQEMAGQMGGQGGGQAARPTFASVDTNEDGFLSSEEISIMAVVANGRQTAEQMMARMDTNTDGKISVEEYGVMPADGGRPPQ